MDYRAVIQESLDRIEEQVRGDISVDRLASHAGFSPYHYYRIFEAYVGMPVMEYIRRRRLAHAAFAMAHTPRLIDIAVEFGFETHAGFTRAFHRCMGVPPEQYRRHTAAVPPQRIVLRTLARYIHEGGIVMEPRIIAKPAAHIAGISIRTTPVDGRNNREIPAFWSDSMKDGSLDRLHGLPGVVSHNELGMCVGTDMETGEFDYVIGLEVTDLSAVPEGYYRYELPACTYAVFTTPPADSDRFSATIQGTWQYIYSEWFPASGYEFAPGCPDFEYYTELSGKPVGAQCDIYIPVVKKA
ncbi:MAG: AraC family transcriptional regulator [Clostridia bacterium]|nr:AraC family transcriptional regulator [Clostridia bacterium]